MDGWKCPGCGKCFSPSVTECSTCGKPLAGTDKACPADSPRYCQYCGSRVYPDCIHLCCGSPIDWGGSTWTTGPDTATQVSKSDDAVATNISRLGSAHLANPT